MLVNLKNLINDRSYSFIYILKNFLLTLTCHCMGEGCGAYLVCMYLSVSIVQANTAHFTVSKTLPCISSFLHFQHRNFPKCFKVKANYSPNSDITIINIYIALSLTSTCWSVSWLLSFFIIWAESNFS